MTNDVESVFVRQIGHGIQTKEVNVVRYLPIEDIPPSYLMTALAGLQDHSAPVF